MAKAPEQPPPLVKVHFFRDFDWPLNVRETVAYKAGMELRVTPDCAKAAIEAGAAEQMQEKANAAPRSRPDEPSVAVPIARDSGRRVRKSDR